MNYLPLSHIKDALVPIRHREIIDKSPVTKKFTKKFCKYILGLKKWASNIAYLVNFFYLKL